MLLVDQPWLLNQTETVSAPSVLNGFVECVPPVGDVWRWRVSNNNVTEAKTTSIFDPSGATFPVESCSVTIVNGMDDTGSEHADYDFTDPTVRDAAKNPGAIWMDFSFDFGG